ncbi:MAG TPA: UPF0175 family protein [Bryobacteraceae bacterium]|jgi:predicted HTH domain antitoxin
MRITVELPDDVARHSEAGREALEALVIQGYREGTLSHYESSRLLGISRFEFDAFLKNRNVYEHAYGLADLEKDLDDLRRFEARNLPSRQ